MLDSLFLVYSVVKTFFDQIVISVFGGAFRCRHSPSCSQFTLQQIKQHGTITGLKKGIRQFSRCWGMSQ